ncbi:hypothetical protein [Catenovulum maritimum]|uniref:Iron transporter n=1 Tax=Catenovulum maritimum TaxID=1513271 RepID=A0A0J8GVE6_9ALTE|nr:hypothetical protein [Catenovulum maritimum]KMT66712.1 hypothetical protein XM47_00865 [Catenovulum maritimum]
MLINTVILFIKEILPVFILLCFVSAFVSSHFVNRANLTRLLIISITFISLIFTNLENISGWYDGDGIEILASVIHFSLYFILLASSCLIMTKKSLNLPLGLALFASVSMFATLHLSEFFLYFFTIIINQQSLATTITGTVFGLGICISFSTLLALLFKGTVNKLEWLSYTFWASYLAGIATQGLTKLQQIGLVDTRQTLWDTSFIISDSSEYGYLLNTLIGYVSAPTREYFLVYTISLFTSIITYCLVFKVARKKMSCSLGDLK